MRQSLLRAGVNLLMAGLFSLSAQNAKLQVPSGLIGTWQSETKDAILVLTDNHVVLTTVTTNETGTYTETFEGTIFLYYDKPGYLAFTLDKATTDGTDATESYKSMGPQFYVAFQTLSAGKGTIKANLAGQGRGLVDESNLRSSDNIQNPKDWVNPKLLKRVDKK